MKLTICVNSHDNLMYAKSAHYRWEKFDTDDEVDLPTQPVKLAKDNIGCEIILNATGSRETTEVAACFYKLPLKNIITQFQQKTVVFGYLLVYYCIR